MSPLVGTSYRLPSHAAQFFGSKLNGPLWGGVPWAESKRQNMSLAGLASAGLQEFPHKALFWESDCDIDYDGPSASVLNATLKKHDQYFQPETSLKWKQPWKSADGALVRYCDSRTFRGIVIPPQFETLFGLKLGDFCVVCENGLIEAAQVYDHGPRIKIGEVSFKLAGDLNIPNNPRTGNDVKDLCTLAFPDSGNGYAVSPAEQWEAIIQLMGKLTGRIT